MINCSEINQTVNELLIAFAGTGTKTGNFSILIEIQ